MIKNDIQYKLHKIITLLEIWTENWFIFSEFLEYIALIKDLTIMCSFYWFMVTYICMHV